ncbi:hypothetical protein MSG28_012704 [Choristoneura fumiferana]|uniref:Uncharacterized protein n=2 Tax=Choristoneura fumiferana TaxID=7141 RepID=A0ACC0JHN5_CHOFU|nr:hypothetical protein MSG28_012704 [Choristoneura fumiferana]
MDESLTDFKEKKSFQGPKNVKASAPKPRAKKAVKRIKGQKDIRIALKPKKNELIAYSKDFDNVCKKSGIDVDSEQLQLAIALSKSLQASESANAPSTSQPLNAQQRTGLIRTTLKEYGFKVPEVKPNINKKNKKRRKPYKLLLTTEDQKQQIISDRYTQLLFELNNSKTTSTSKDLDTSSIFLYNMASNIEYGDIKNDDVFYVEDLIEKSPNNMGCLLKDWSNIPGRLTSPMQEKSEIVFSEIECSQDELDIVLSGSLKSSKDILKRRNLYRRKTIVCIDNDVIDKTHEVHVGPASSACDDEILSPEVVTIVCNSSNTTVTEDNSTEIITVLEKQLLTVTQPCRSLSPDLFDDDDDDTVVEIAEKSPVKLVTNVTKEASTFMDLTECVNIVSQNIINSDDGKVKKAPNLSQGDVTKRKSNDFMEMTDCVGVSSQPIKEMIEEHIDLTIPCMNNEALERKSICVENIHSVEHMDLTQSSNSSNESLPFVHISGKERVQEKSLDDTIILNDNDYQEVNTVKINTVANENINIVLNDNRHKSHATELNAGSDEIIKINSQESLIDVPKEASIVDLDASHIDDKVEDNIDVTQTFVPKNASILDLDASNIDDKVEDNIDLTQTSKSNESDICSPVKNTPNCMNSLGMSSLGKKDDVSVDYDEALENMNCYTDHAYDLNFNADNSVLEDNKLDTSKKEVQFHNNEDNEVVGLPGSRLKSSNRDTDLNFDIGGISVINGLQSFNRESRNTIYEPNGSMRDSLPIVEIGGTEPPPKPKPPFDEFPDPVDHMNSNFIQERTKTPTKAANLQIAVTPKQSEYIVRTDNITPMADYAAMTSPERNRELDKYGLKPFKRKRAIQLLTHLYNQTHPFVESAQELTSPSKKRKLECLTQPSTSKSPRKVSKSPKKSSKPNTSKSPRNGSEGAGSLNVPDKENDMFMVTNEVPTLRDIECDADDWVFQKREKAKLHSCRVPLHIAFHNFVSCRRLLHEAILRYEPVNIDVIHKELVASGHRYDPKDLLKFMDKKCITVKTADNAKNKNRY